MSTTANDITWLNTQLTMAQWHLDAALAAPVEGARRNIDRARQAYDAAREALRELDLTAERRKELADLLARIRDRLQSAGADV